MKVDPLKCPQDHKCPAINICPQKAITQVNNNLPVIDNEKCINCGECIYFCPMGGYKRIILYLLKRGDL
jgi:ferredoxin